MTGSERAFDDGFAGTLTPGPRPALLVVDQRVRGREARAVDACATHARLAVKDADDPLSEFGIPFRYFVNSEVVPVGIAHFHPPIGSVQ